MTCSLTILRVPQSELSDALQLRLESMIARQLSPNTIRGYMVNLGAFIRFLHSLNLDTLDAVQPAHTGLRAHEAHRLTV